jgi:hypothetical protein
MKTKISSCAAGDMIDGQYIGVPVYYKVESIFELDSCNVYLRHAAVDFGKRKARKMFSRLNHKVRLLAKACERHEAHVVLHTGGLSYYRSMYSFPTSSSVTMLIWICRDNRILRQIVVHEIAGKTCWLDPHGDPAWRTYTNNHVFLRKLLPAEVASTQIT